ncbi:MAG: hypothetical protein WCA04_04195 [Geobacteraceae bacterium]
MGDFESKGKKGASWCDDCINVSDSAQQMRQDFAELISRCFPKDWREIEKEMEKIHSKTVDALPQRSSSGREAPAVELCQEGVSAEANSAMNAEFPDIPLPAKGVGPGEQEEEIAAGEEFPSYQNLYGDPFLEGAASASKRRLVRRLLLACILLAVAGSSLYFWMVLKSKNPVHVASPPAAPNSESTARPTSPPMNSRDGIKGLPSFVHSEWRDSEYSAKHPGWERYVSPEIDFRIYRENDRIKAIQGISRDHKGLSETFLSQILNQLGISGSLSSGKETTENGLLIKDFLLRGAELVTYQEQGSSHIKAFVLEFT